MDFASIVASLPLPLPLLHAIPTLLMTGVIWIIQVVHYPLYRRVGADAFADYEREHCARIAFVVLPLMVAELACAVSVNEGKIWCRSPPPGELRHSTRHCTMRSGTRVDALHLSR